MLQNIFPVILFLFLGYFFKKIEFITRDQSLFLLKIVFYIAAPSTIFLAIKNTKLEFQFIYLALSALIIILLTFFVMVFFLLKKNIAKIKKGVLLIAATIMNLGFMLPVAILFFGDAGVARLTMIDIVNIFFALTLCHYIAIRYGTNHNSFTKKEILLKIISAPVFIALILGLTFNFTRLYLPSILEQSVFLLNSMTVPMTLIATGSFLSFKSLMQKEVFWGVLGRTVLGGLIGLVLFLIMPLDLTSSKILLLSSIAPSGILTIIFSGQEHLDTELAGSIVSLTIILSLILIGVIGWIV